MHRTAVKKVVLEGVLDANDALAQANRQMFDQGGRTYVINMMSSPGAGKTALLERTLERIGGKEPLGKEPLGKKPRLGVLEGDVQTTLDADRLARFHIPLVQVNTDPGFGGECHLDANMVRSGLSELPLGDIDALIIENVGNLVCPAEFRVGEDARVMVYSVTEGEEKPLKYPLMFRSVVNKVDLLPHLDFDMEQFLGYLDAVNPGVPRILTSARTGQGVDEWYAWLRQCLSTGDNEMTEHDHSKTYAHEHRHGNTMHSHAHDEHDHEHSHEDGTVHPHPHAHQTGAEEEHDHDHG